MSSIKVNIKDYISTQNAVNAADLAVVFSLKINTARQYLSELSRGGGFVRTSRGVYAASEKQNFTYLPSKTIKSIYNNLVKQLPFNDFCVYDGEIFNPLQHHIFNNKAIYVETNSDSVETVFERLKTQYKNTYRRPDSKFMTDYVDLRQHCIIVKKLVTESPIVETDGVRVPTLEKILVDILKDPDFDYLQGSESFYIFRAANELYNINFQRLMRYAKRRGAGDEINTLIQQSANND